ncbi:serpin family protein [Streptomyces viridochromogenes]|uniref:serpin family protein n=1 Tax=Streptomyces viridochromogenes TaxID=1938 RepID=UPI00277D0ADD|nr:serpin family protein [Streptomyces viridochromogenes]
MNGLTARWARTAGAGRGTVLSAAGVWPLLAFLADGADGPARTELADAVGLDADEAAGAARELLDALGGMRGLERAVGLWTDRTLELRERWEAALPAEAHGVLTGDAAADGAALNAWAGKHTDGLVDRMPALLDPGTQLVLASALTLRTRWLRPFEETAWMPEAGPWWGRELTGLMRSGAVLDRVGVADTPAGRVTELKVLGDTAADVHLVLGEDGMTPGQVLGAAVEVLERRSPAVPGHALPYGEVGPGLSVVRKLSREPDPPTLHVLVPAFGLRADHDLTASPGVFGLTTARDRTRGHFPGISASPLAVGSCPAVRDGAVRRRRLPRGGGDGDRGDRGRPPAAASMADDAGPRHVRPALRLPRRAPAHPPRPRGGLGRGTRTPPRGRGLGRLTGIRTGAPRRRCGPCPGARCR